MEKYLIWPLAIFCYFIVAVEMMKMAAARQDMGESKKSKDLIIAIIFLAMSQYWTILAFSENNNGILPGNEMAIIGTLGTIMGLISLIIILIFGPDPKKHPMALGILTGIAAVGTTLGIVVFSFNAAFTVITLLVIAAAIARIVYDTAKKYGK